MLRLADMLVTAWARRRDYDVAQVDVFSGHAFQWAEAVCWVLRRAQKPYVLALRGGDLPAFAARHRRRVTALLGSAAAVVTPSAYLMRALRGCVEVDRVIPNAIDLPAYDGRVRRSVRPRLVWLRAFHDIYNPSMAIAVLARLRSDGTDAHLTMIGPDKRDGSLTRARGLAASLGVEPFVEFSGPVAKSAIGAALQPYDILLNTPDVDNMPVTVIEALASGLCVVSTDAGGLRDLLTDEHDALLVPPGDADAMTVAVRRLLSDPGLAEALSRNGRRTAEAYAWPLALNAWEHCLVSAASTRGAAASVPEARPHRP